MGDGRDIQPNGAVVDRQRPAPDRGGGGLAFAAIMLLLGAVFSAVFGVTALTSDDYLRADELLFGDLSMWGVIYLVFAAMQLIAVLPIGAYPIWSVILLVVDGLILYGLSVYGLGPSDGLASTGNYTEEES